MTTQNSKLSIQKVLPKSILEQNMEALELYKETDGLLKETTDILEQTAIALGRKKIYTYSSNSTKNCDINHYGISLTTKNYQQNPLKNDKKTRLTSSQNRLSYEGQTA